MAPPSEPTSQPPREPPSERRGSPPGRRSLAAIAFTLAAGLLAAALSPTAARALGESSLFDVRSVDYDGGQANPRPNAPRRLAWEVRKRTSIETRVRPTRARLDSTDIFENPFLYWSGDRAFPPLSEAEVSGLRRFLRFGGFLLVDDSAPEGAGFDRSVRRELGRALPRHPLRPVPQDHTLFRSFYLLSRPVGRIRGPAQLEGIALDQRMAVVYSRHDLGGAWARDNLGSWEHAVTPGGSAQREQAIRLGVNLVMYALCLDYKDDQVHAPFIMRRRGRSP